MITQPLTTGDPLRLGPYRLIGVLGEGGMGKVYMGQDSSGRPAAVKVLRPELAHDQHLAHRFVREAEMARAVTSRGVARVLGSQTEGGRPWIAAEFLAGPTLDEAVRAYGPMDEPTVRALGHFLSRTLHDIHAAGLVHRDLKPANIVLTSSGPRVIDFGIARPEHGLTLTTTGQIPVTPGYGAPEQVLGQRVGPSADVFSLGAVLVYAATGRRAFDAAHVAAVQYEVVHGNPDMHQVPAALQLLIGPCLAKDPALRPTPAQIATAVPAAKGADRSWRKGPLAEDIRGREASVKQLVVPLTTVAPKTGSERPSRRRFLAATGAGVLVAGAGAGTWWMTRSGSDPRGLEVPPAAAAPRAAFASVIDTKAGEPPKPLWGPLDVAAPFGKVPLPVRDVLVVHAASGGLLALAVTDGRRRWEARNVDAQAGYVSVADRLVVAADEGGVLRAFVASTGVPVWDTDIAAAGVLAADARHVYVVTKDNRLRAIDAWTLTTTWSRPMVSPISAFGPAKAATGKDRLIVHGWDGQVIAVDTKTGRTVWAAKDQGRNGTTPAIGGNIAYVAGPNLVARTLDEGKLLWSEESRSSRSLGHGWGSPTAAEGVVYAVDGYNARRYSTRPGVSFAVSDWYEILDGLGGTLMAPAAEGATVWLPAPDASNVRVIHKKTHRLFFTLKMKRDGEYQLASGDNRVFIARSGRVMAMPVFGS